MTTHQTRSEEGQAHTSLEEQVDADFACIRRRALLRRIGDPIAKRCCFQSAAVLR
jgi:hypothetical protein